MLVSINPERMLVQVDRNLGLSPDGLAAGVREALTIHDGLQTGVAARLGEGVAIVAAGPASAEDAGPADVQGLRRPDRGRPQGRLRDLPDPPPPRLLGVHRRLLGLRLQGEDRPARLIGRRRVAEIVRIRGLGHSGGGPGRVSWMAVGHRGSGEFAPARPQ